MFSNVAQPDVSLSDWQNFPQLSVIDKIIERKEARLPEWFLPMARGVAVASATLLRQAGYRRGMDRPARWHETSDGFFRTLIDCGTRLIVRQSEDLDLWTIERWSFKRGPEVDDVLVCDFGATPIFTRDSIAAMVLAMHCHSKGPPPGLSWFKSPHNLQAVVDMAKQRQLNESAA